VRLDQRLVTPAGKADRVAHHRRRRLELHGHFGADLHALDRSEAAAGTRHDHYGVLIIAATEHLDLEPAVLPGDRRPGLPVREEDQHAERAAPANTNPRSTLRPAGGVEDDAGDTTLLGRWRLGCQLDVQPRGGPRANSAPLGLLMASREAVTS